MTQLQFSDLWGPPPDIPEPEEKPPPQLRPAAKPPAKPPDILPDSFPHSTQASTPDSLRECYAAIQGAGRCTPLAAMLELSKLLSIRQDQGQRQFQQRRGESENDLTERLQQTYRQIQPTTRMSDSQLHLDSKTAAHCVDLLQHLNNTGPLATSTFDSLLEDLFRGEFGQYFTPRNLVTFAVALLDPQEDELIIDPACGSAGFLTETTAHISRTSIPRPENLFGIEISSSLADIARTSTALQRQWPHSERPNIINHDALDLWDNLRLQHPRLSESQFDVILTNPPFGQSLTRDTKGDSYLDQFEIINHLGGPNTSRNTGKSRKPRQQPVIKTEVAYLDRVHSLLKPGTGRAAILVPDGLLNNPSLQGVREWALQHFQLLAVISLPEFAFNHQGSGAKTSFIFLRRLADQETVPDQTPNLMALAESVGYDRSGRPDWDSTTTESETPGVERTVLETCDLFQQRSHYLWSKGTNNKRRWLRISKEVITNTGIQAEWIKFQRDPASFLT